MLKVTVEPKAFGLRLAADTVRIGVFKLAAVTTGEERTAMGGNECEDNGGNTALVRTEHGGATFRNVFLHNISPFSEVIFQEVCDQCEENANAHKRPSFQY